MKFFFESYGDANLILLQVERQRASLADVCFGIPIGIVKLVNGSFDVEGENLGDVDVDISFKMLREKVHYLQNSVIFHVNFSICMYVCTASYLSSHRCELLEDRFIKLLVSVILIFRLFSRRCALNIFTTTNTLLAGSFLG